MWMTVNKQIPIIVQVYANNIAMQFFNDINSTSPTMNSFAMGPGGDSEFAGYLNKLTKQLLSLATRMQKEQFFYVALMITTTALLMKRINTTKDIQNLLMNFLLSSLWIHSEKV